MKVQVTGAAGFIGRALAERLVLGGHQVFGLDMRPSIDTDLLVDIRDGAAMQAVMAATSPDVVVHLAALAGVRPSVARPIDYLETNVVGTGHVLEAAAQAGVRRVVLASSSSVYGHCPEPAHEDRTPRPLSPYAASKLAAEALAQTYAERGCLEVAVVRPFTVYGPGQRPDMFCSQVLRTLGVGAPLEVWPWQRDFTFIDDLVDGLVGASSRRLVEPFRIFNLGSGTPVSAADFLSTLEFVTGFRPEATWGRASSGEPARTHADPVRARLELGFTGATSFADGLRQQADVDGACGRSSAVSVLADRRIGSSYGHAASLVAVDRLEALA